MRFALSLLTLAASAAFAHTPAATAPAATPADASATTATSAAPATRAPKAGVPVELLAKDAPARYTVKKGDTLWGISGMYLKNPWMWPELWGANRAHIANPHRIYPGQELVLIRSATHARLAREGAEDIDPLDPNHPNAQYAPGDTAPVAQQTGPRDVRLSPTVRAEAIGTDAIPTLKMHLLEPFLTEPLVASANTFAYSPRVVAGAGDKQLMGPGDTLYAVTEPPRAGDDNAQAHLAYTPLSQSVSRNWLIMRQGQALTDPTTGEVLGWQADYVGRAELQVDQPENLTADAHKAALQPAQLRIERLKQEIVPGDRLVPEPKRQFQNFVPHAPTLPVAAQVVQVHGGALQGSTHSVIAINRGRIDGVQPGMVLSVLQGGVRVMDRHAPGGQQRAVQLPSVAHGHAMVFRTFDRVSYALILNSLHAVRRGDRLTNPQ